MTMKTKVKAATSTHTPDGYENLSVEQGDAGLMNSQTGSLLIDPDEVCDQVATHSAEEVEFRGAKTVASTKTKAVKAGAGQQSVVDKELPAGGNVNVPNDVDPAQGYLQKESGMPVIENASVEEDDFADGDELTMMASDDDEFDDLAEVEADADEVDDDDTFDAEELTGDLDFGDEEEAAEDEGAELDVTADFENVRETEEDIPLVDIDEVSDDDTSLVFASLGKALHVIQSNRIIASMGPNAAARASVEEVYMLPQFQDVVASAVVKKGLRKGLVQAGFVLAKVRVTASKTTAKVVKAKVEAQVQAKMESLAKHDGVMEQALAIAATGINKNFFTGHTNVLRAALETELEQAGVRGGTRLVRAMFAQHGVSYAKALLTVAKKISAMPEDVRNSYVDALDMSGDDVEADLDTDEDDDQEDLDVEVEATTVKAALSRPLQQTRTAALLRASHGDSGAFAILSGAKSLV